MPHITISAVPGHSTEEKARLAEKIAELTAAEFHVPQDIVSVSMREISKSEWRAFMKQFPKEELLIIPPYLEDTP